MLILTYLDLSNTIILLAVRKYNDFPSYPLSGLKHKTNIEIQTAKEDVVSQCRQNLQTVYEKKAYDI